MRIDLHTHSTFSDGTMTPTELIRYAKEKNLKAIALTDHDTIDGLHEAMTASKDLDIEFINGIEIACTYRDIEIHMLGLLFDRDSESLNHTLKELQTARKNRNSIMLALFKNEGIEIEREVLEEATDKNIITRAHFAKALLQRGYVKTLNEAFTKYLSDGTRTYVKRKKLLPEDSIELIKKAGGLSILAHPVFYKLDYLEIEAMVKKLKSYGLDGMECIYSTHTQKDQLELTRIARKYDLKITGGSDFHGANKKHIDLGTGFGGLFVPYGLLDILNDR